MARAEGTDLHEGNAVLGIDVPAVTGWFAANVPGVAPPLRFALIAGGRSNLTYRVDDTAGGSWVLRRPPLGHLLPTAHDMAREHRIISALGPTAVPAPPAIGFCDDPAVCDQPFYVMAFVEGHILRSAEEAASVLGPQQRRVAGESLVDVLAEIHAVDPDEVGLGDLSRREGYLSRQLRRWQSQWEQSRTRDLPVVDRVHDRLLATVPEQSGAAIVHGDYRLDNTLLGDDGRVRAVLDWELCTLGDPLADVGLLMVYWADPGDDAASLPLGLSPTTARGFPTKEDLKARYAERSGRDVSRLGYYVAFGYWKLACIVEGVYARYAGGAMGNDGVEAGTFGDQVATLAAAAEAALEDGG